MQTSYNTTDRLNSRTGNVIDLSEYRPVPCDLQREDVQEQTERRARRGHQSTFVQMMDGIASMGIIFMTFAFAFWVLTAG